MEQMNGDVQAAKTTAAEAPGDRRAICDPGAPGVRRARAGVGSGKGRRRRSRCRRARKGIGSNIDSRATGQCRPTFWASSPNAGCWLVASTKRCRRSRWRSDVPSPPASARGNRSCIVFAGNCDFARRPMKRQGAARSFQPRLGRRAAAARARSMELRFVVDHGARFGSFGFRDGAARARQVRGRVPQEFAHACARRGAGTVVPAVAARRLRPSRAPQDT
jgi:hypothetical protein